MLSVGFIGGDLRQLTLLEKFREKGYAAKIYGYDSSEFNTENIEDIYTCDIIIFPMPSCFENKIFAPFTKKQIYIDDLKLPCGKTIFYAGGGTEFINKLINSGSNCIDYMKCDDLIIKNAVPTAEGAVEIVLNETAYTIFGSDALIIGYGNVAKALAKVLKALGANITVAARRACALAEAWSEGYDTVYISEISKSIYEYNLIFNTVPALILTKDVLANADKNSLIIDLASKPGGVDFDAAKELELKVIWALSLPGKTAPLTAGEIIFDTISRILSEKAGDENGA